MDISCISWPHIVSSFISGTLLYLTAHALFKIQAVPRWRKEVVYIPTPKTEEYVSDKYTISISAPQGKLECWGIGPADNPKAAPYGWMWIEFDTKTRQCFLWVVFIHRRHRRKGYGRAMIGLLQEKFKIITSGYETKFISEEGVKLCMACGFTIKPALHRRKANLLVWRKE